jgi:uncharacterized heparinase superfamily protein
MFFWLETMCHPDKQISFFNDAALGVAPTLQELKEYAQRLLPDFPSAHQKDRISKQKTYTHLTASGYCRLQRDKITLLADIANVAASYQPGHAHADTLSFELSVKDQRLIVNSGTSCYTRDEERLRQRSSKAHNTLVIDDHNSSEVWSSFRVARRANVFGINLEKNEDQFILTARHDGYYRLNKIIHTRKWIAEDNELLIQDRVSGVGVHKMELFFHIHPDNKLVKINDQCMILSNQSNQPIAKIESDYIIKIEDSTYHPAFNLCVPNKKLVITKEQTLPAEFNTSIKWNF